MTIKAYLQFGGAALGSPSGPFETVEVPVKETETPRSGMTQTGYGPKLPTPYLVKYNGKWRRVYVCNYGNAGTAYIGKPGAWEAIVNVVSIAGEAPLIIEICPTEPRASLCLANGESVKGSDYETDILDCTGSGDAEPACTYVRDHIGVEFRIIARTVSGEYENRLATAEEMQATCEAIYFDSDTDFTDRDTAAMYLIWDAASGFEAELQYAEADHAKGV